MRRLLVACCLFVLGCASFRDAWDQDILYLKMCGEAERAWRECRPVNAEEMAHAKDYEKGFMDGYVAVAFGANGCPPTLPSREYWKTRFKNDEGKSRIATWYNGYAAGASAGLANGVQDRNRLPTAGELYGRHAAKSEAAGTAVLPPIPSHELTPPGPELLEAPPPIPDAAPLPPPEAAWRPSTLESTPPAAGVRILPLTEATVEAIPETKSKPAAELAGPFGLSRP